MKLYIILFLILINSLELEAQELFHTNTSVRALGMGNAYVAVVNDIDSMFYNPAGFAQNSQFNWTIMDPKIGVGGVESVQKLSNLQSSGGFASTLRELYGEKVYVNVGAKTAIVTPWFAAALYDNIDTSLRINNPAVPEIDANIVNDLGVGLGFGFSILPGFQMGMTFKRITRTGSRFTLGSSLIGSLDPEAIKDEVMRTGLGYSTDLGFNIAPNLGVVEPVISFVWKDLGVTSFRPTEDGGLAPPSDKDNMIFGFALILDVGLVHLIPSFEYQYINDSDIQIGKKINLGLEVGLPLLNLRGGFHQGYYTLGVGVNLGLLRIDAASYGVELGAYPGQLEDRRYILQLTMELGFDANLSFLGGGSGGGQGGPGGNRSRLKQRR
ncbi:MAG: hypothetical protein H6625_02045 [Bdellovibrionaceae bacterium]|nr:hypothetical protein [Pseudobdellovibrionaceae bacterium]